MRISTSRPQPLSIPTARPATATVTARATAVDAFDAPKPKTAGLKQELTKAAGQVAEQALGSLVEKLMNKLIERVGAWLDRVLGNKPAPQPALPAPSPSPVQPAPSPAQPAPSAPAGLAPTPLRKDEPPNVVGYVNTPQNKKIAPKSTFNDAVNAAIDRVREQGIGIDTLDPERNRISNFDAYHSAVVTELRKAGYHAAYDGEELSVGRVGDNHSEQFDISTWQGQVRRFYASWQTPHVFDV